VAGHLYLRCNSHLVSLAEQTSLVHEHRRFRYPETSGARGFIKHSFSPGGRRGVLCGHLYAELVRRCLTQTSADLFA
jgi:hypothetical protein